MFLASRVRVTKSLYIPLARACSSAANASYCYLTEDNIIKSVHKDIDFPVEDVFSFFSKKFLEHGDEIAVVDEISGKSMTYTEIVNNSRRLASFFDEQGLHTGDIAAIHAPNCLEYSYACLGTLANGMSFNTANSAYTPYELRNMLVDSKPKVLFTSSEQMEVARQSVDGTAVEMLVCVDDAEISDSGVSNLSDILATGDEHFSKDLSAIDPKTETAFLLYSSGTTGLPKGVMISHHALTSNMMVLSKHINEEGLFPASILCILPMYHIYGLSYILLLHLYLKSRVHTLQGFEPEQFLSTLQNRKIEKVPIVPPVALFLSQHPVVDKFDLSSIHTFTVAAAPMDEIATNQFYKKFPDAQLQQGYGMTETNATHVQPQHRELQKPGSCGVVIPGIESKVVCLVTGKALGPNEQGEVCVRGYQQMLGYLNNPEATAATIDEEGWVHSGDLGYYDDDLHFFVIDRLKELIKYKAYQVAPAELEDLLIGHEDIVDACVIGVPCDRSGEIPRAYVVRKPDSSLTEEDVTEHVASTLSDHKKLRGGVEFIEQLPKSPAGKLLRRVLKDKYVAESQ